MDKYIDQMVAKDIEPAKIVIESESETGYGSIKDGGVVAIGIESSSKIFPCYFFEVQIGIIGNVCFIVKMPRAVERIPVY